MGISWTTRELTRENTSMHLIGAPVPPSVIKYFDPEEGTTTCMTEASMHAIHVKGVSITSLSCSLYLGQEQERVG